MFNRIPIDQFHASSTSTFMPLTPQIPPSSNLNFISFDPLLYPLPHHQTSFQSHDDQPKQEQDTWSNEEVIQLLRIKSSSENWFQDLTWDHVSRKMAEIGYKKSAGKCKEKFEEETCRSFSNAIMYSKNNTRYMMSEELDEHMYHVDQNTHHHLTIDFPYKVNHQCPTQNEVQGQKGNFEDDQKVISVQSTQGDPSMVKQEMEKNNKGVERNFEGNEGQKGNFEDEPREVIVEETIQDNEQRVKKRKRKHKKFEMLKGLCVDIVHKMMAHQEAMHNKLLQEMANHEHEKIAREESWKNELNERVKKEIHIREHEQAIAQGRQSTINELLNKFTNDNQKIQLPFHINYDELLSIMTDNRTEIRKIPKIPFSEKTIENPVLTKNDDFGKRWPRDEVLALINIKCNVCNGIVCYNEENEGYVGNFKGGGSLWERVSQGMLELGYKRSAKRCKEKWENINKYFRKTKDAKKQRSSNSRTCPYYHQLSTLYNQGKHVLSSAPNQLENGPHE